MRAAYARQMLCRMFINAVRHQALTTGRSGNREIDTPDTIYLARAGDRAHTTLMNTTKQAEWNVADILAILDRESVRSSNAPDMRRVMNQMALELRAAGERRAKRGQIVRYDGVGEVEFGGVTAAENQIHMARKIKEALSTLRLWGVEVEE